MQLRLQPERRVQGRWETGEPYLTVLHFIRQNMNDWLRPAVSTEQIQFIYGLQSSLKHQHTTSWMFICGCLISMSWLWSSSGPLPFLQSCRWAPGCPGWSCHLVPTSHNPAGVKSDVVCKIIASIYTVYIYLYIYMNVSLQLLLWRIE